MKRNFPPCLISGVFFLVGTICIDKLDTKGLELGSTDKGLELGSSYKGLELGSTDKGLELDSKNKEQDMDTPSGDTGTRYIFIYIYVYL